MNYQPRGNYHFGVEILTSEQLRNNETPEHFRIPQMVSFFLLLAVEEGKLRHDIDFVPYEVGPSEWLLVKPGQVQHFHHPSCWHGYIIMIEPSIFEWSIRQSQEIDLLQRVQQLPALLQPDSGQSLLCQALVRQIASDAHLVEFPASTVHRLLQWQLNTLMLRLSLPPQAKATVVADSKLRVTFIRYRDLVEQHFREWHQVASYAQVLGYSERTLVRACLAITGGTAKQLLDSRIGLEAKRMLGYSEFTVSQIALQLGFVDASNFQKFFKRQAACPPGEFRERQRAALLSNDGR
ncbi:AraC family transcriptional regulator [Neisseriaceae bacterium TC5R-5]|nr:AraC family transcriptional regulator [Neisseriaceae bacterium TC5R-5]